MSRESVLLSTLFGFRHDLSHDLWTPFYDSYLLTYVITPPSLLLMPPPSPHSPEQEAPFSWKMLPPVMVTSPPRLQIPPPQYWWKQNVDMVVHTLCTHDAYMMHTCCNLFLWESVRNSIGDCEGLHKWFANCPSRRIIRELPRRKVERHWNTSRTSPDCNSCLAYALSSWCGNHAHNTIVATRLTTPLALTLQYIYLGDWAFTSKAMFWVKFAMP